MVWSCHHYLRGVLRVGFAKHHFGEVCAGIIVNAIALGAEGPAVTIAVLCLAVNMTCVSGFIFAVKKLTSKGELIEPKE